MRAAGMEALLGWRPDEIVMLAGYLPHWGLSVCLCPADDEPILYIPELEPRDGLPAGITVKTFPWGILDEPDPWSKLLAMIRADAGRRRIGIQRSVAGSALPSHPAEIPPFPSERLPGEDATAVFTRLFSVKTPAEIERIRVANRIAQHGLKTFRQNLQPGRTEAEIAGAIEAAIQTRTGEVRYARAWAYVHAGERTAHFGRYNRSTGRRLQKDDIVCLELGTCVDGYWSDLTRTRGPEKLLSVVREAQQAAIATIRPGVTGGEVDRAARAVIESRGFGRYFNHATGHPVGFRYHDGGPMLAPGNTVRLEPGMILTVEPGIYGEKLGGGCRIEDNVLVTTTGAEVLSDGQD